MSSRRLRFTFDEGRVRDWLRNEAEGDRGRFGQLSEDDVYPWDPRDLYSAEDIRYLLTFAYEDRIVQAPPGWFATLPVTVKNGEDAEYSIFVSRGEQLIFLTERKPLSDLGGGATGQAGALAVLLELVTSANLALDYLDQLDTARRSLGGFHDAGSSDSDNLTYVIFVRGGWKELVDKIGRATGLPVLSLREMPGEDPELYVSVNGHLYECSDDVSLRVIWEWESVSGSREDWVGEPVVLQEESLLPF